MSDFDPTQDYPTGDDSVPVPVDPRNLPTRPDEFFPF